MLSNKNLIVNMEVLTNKPMPQMFELYSFVLDA